MEKRSWPFTKQQNQEVEVNAAGGILPSVKVNVGSTHRARISLVTAATTFDSTLDGCWNSFTLCFVLADQMETHATVVKLVST